MFSSDGPGINMGGFGFIPGMGQMPGMGGRGTTRVFTSGNMGEGGCPVQ